jgi:hypothetical protein
MPTTGAGNEEQQAEPKNRFSGFAIQNTLSAPEHEGVTVIPEPPPGHVPLGITTVGFVILAALL